MDDEGPWPDSWITWSKDRLELPQRCPRGHRLIGGKVLLGSRGGHHTSWILCRTCFLVAEEVPGEPGRLRWRQDFVSDVIKVDPA